MSESTVDKIEMAVMNSSGDSKLIFDPKNPKEVEMAQETFDAYRKKGFAAFRLKRWTGKGERLDKFDPTVNRILFVPPLVGG